jgi:prepilin-type N-terminal cleavage/methylation domain-containing protein
MNSYYRQSGFTIVELLIVIVVIAILAAITIVSFNGIQTRANNSSRVSEFSQWRKSFEIYKINTGAYPVVPIDKTYCLGTNFPNGKCRDYKRDPLTQNNVSFESNSADLMAMIKQYTSIPQGKHVPVVSEEGDTVGPYVTFGTNYIEMTMVINGKDGGCPPDTYQTYFNAPDKLLCSIGLTR